MWSVLTTGEAELVFLLLTRFCKVHVTCIFLPNELVGKIPALQHRGCSALCAPRRETSARLSWGFMTKLKCSGALGWKMGRKGFESCVVSPPDGCWGRGAMAGDSKAPGAAPAGRGRFRVGDVVHLVQERHHLRPLGTCPLRQDLLHDGTAGKTGMWWDGFESTRVTWVLWRGA